MPLAAQRVRVQVRAAAQWSLCGLHSGLERSPRPLLFCARERRGLMNGPARGRREIEGQGEQLTAPIAHLERAIRVVLLAIPLVAQSGCARDGFITCGISVG